MYDVLVLAEMLMQNYFHLDLLRREAALFVCMFFIDELDRDDGLRLIVGYSFTYSSVLSIYRGGVPLEI